jgi:hypothetical protein
MCTGMGSTSHSVCCSMRAIYSNPVFVNRRALMKWLLNRHRRICVSDERNACMQCKCLSDCLYAACQIVPRLCFLKAFVSQWSISNVSLNWVHARACSYHWCDKGGCALAEHVRRSRIWVIGLAALSVSERRAHHSLRPALPGNSRSSSFGHMEVVSPEG